MILSERKHQLVHVDSLIEIRMRGSLMELVKNGLKSWGGCVNKRDFILVKVGDDLRLVGFGDNDGPMSTENLFASGDHIVAVVVVEEIRRFATFREMNSHAVHIHSFLMLQWMRLWSPIIELYLIPMKLILTVSSLFDLDFASVSPEMKKLQSKE